MMLLAGLLFWAAVAYFYYLVKFEIVAFRCSGWWGVGSLFLFPVRLLFLVLHWQDVRTPFFGMLVSGLVGGAALGGMLASNAEFAAGFAKIADARHHASSSGTSLYPGTQRATPPPREAHDIAVQTVPEVAVSDPNSGRRDALKKHAEALALIYADLARERATLSTGSPGVAKFNVKAASYQRGVTALAAEQAELEKLDHPQVAPAPAISNDPKERQAAADLQELQNRAAQADFAGFATTLKKSVAEDRNTKTYPKIVATAHQTLAHATPDRLSAALQARASSAKAELDAAMSQVRAIVNQKPSPVPKPPVNAEVYHSELHPGAITPDYAHAVLARTREVSQGDYVYMVSAPGVYYRSAECEFNPQTKFFYTDRNVPKKKLTDPEMAAVEKLYRTIAADQEIISTLPQRLRETRTVSSDLLSLNKQIASSN